MFSVPVMRKRSPATCWVKLSSQKKLTVATMQPQSRTATAMPRKPAVILLRSALEVQTFRMGSRKNRVIENWRMKSFANIANTGSLGVCRLGVV